MADGWTVFILPFCRFISPLRSTRIILPLCSTGLILLLYSTSVIYPSVRSFSFYPSVPQVSFYPLFHKFHFTLCSTSFILPSVPHASFTPLFHKFHVWFFNKYYLAVQLSWSPLAEVCPPFLLFARPLAPALILLLKVCYATVSSLYLVRFTPPPHKLLPNNLG